MNSKKLNCNIYRLQSRIFAIKLEVNSNYGSISINMINERNKLKKELSHLLRVQKLRKERKEKLEQIMK